MKQPDSHPEPDLFRPGDEAWNALVRDLQAPPPVRPGRDPLQMARAIQAECAASARPSMSAWARAAAAVLVLLGGLLAALQLNRGGPARPAADAAAGAAIASGTRWLLAAQSPDGSWNPEAWGGHAAFRSGLTGLAVVALLSEPDPSPAATDAVARAAGWFAARALSAPASGRDLPYNLGLAALAQVEAAHRLPGAVSRDHATRALRQLVRLQQPDGGWGYATSGGVGYDTPLTAFSNASATTWPLRALRRARELGWAGLDEACGRGERWLASRRGPDGRVGYRLAGDHPFGWETLTAMAGWLSPPAAGADVPAQSAPSDRYQGFFLSRVAPPATRRELGLRLLDQQDPAGAWPVEGDRWKMAGGRLYGTCFALLSLRDERAGG